MKLEHTPGYITTREGRVFSCATNWRGYGRREMKQELNSNGYPSVRIIIDGKRKRVCVHRLVMAQHMAPKPNLFYETRHLDGNKTNNHYTNLAWGTRKDNAEDREKHGRTSKGEKHCKAIKEGIYAKR